MVCFLLSMAEATMVGWNRPQQYMYGPFKEESRPFSFFTFIILSVKMGINYSSVCLKEVTVQSAQIVYCGCHSSFAALS